jgi:hypothetical protein
MAQTEKTTLCFENAALIKELLRDISKLEKKTKSGIIESCVLNTLLPSDNEIRKIVEEYLYSEKNSLSMTLSLVFNYNSLHINGVSIHDNYAPLVQFARRQEIYKPTLLSKNKINPEYLKMLVQHVIDCIKNYGDDYIEKARYDIEILESIDIDSPAAYILDCILDCWEVLSDKPDTYKILSDIAAISDWECNTYTRRELLTLLNDVTAEW